MSRHETSDEFETVIGEVWNLSDIFFLFCFRLAASECFQLYVKLKSLRNFSFS